MGKLLIALFILPLENLMSRARLFGQDYVSYGELKALFGNTSLHPEVLEVFDNIRKNQELRAKATRETVLLALLDVARSRACGAEFLKAAIRLNLPLPPDLFVGMPTRASKCDLERHDEALISVTLNVPVEARLL